MSLKGVLIHAAICAAVATPIAYFTDVKWLAAAFFVSAALFLNGSFAIYEDTRVGGFDNPDGADTPSFARGPGAIRYWLSSLAMTTGLALAGLAAQLFS